MRSRARRALDVSQRFGDDTLGYFTERLDPAVTRRAAVTAVRQAKRHKAPEQGRPGKHHRRPAGDHADDEGPGMAGQAGKRFRHEGIITPIATIL